MTSPFCLPEKIRPYYFAQNGKYHDSGQPITVQDFTLWAKLSALDTLTSDITVVATKSQGSSAFMYRIDFDSEPPQIFDIEVESGMKIVYIPADRFLQLEALHPCVPVPQNNWEECSLRFHSLAAFYRLNVIPSLSLSLFEREDFFESICDLFYDKYRVSPPFGSALFDLFSKTLSALDFFGFTIPSNVQEETSIKACHDFIALVENSIHMTETDIYTSAAYDSSTLLIRDSYFHKSRSAAFSELRFAIKNYITTCFPNRQKETGLPLDVLDYSSYSNLHKTIEFVHHSLVSLNLMSKTLSSLSELKAAVNVFQTKNELPVGCCDLFTIRHLWNASMTNECNLPALCRLSGMTITIPKFPIYTKTLNRIDPSQLQKEYVSSDKIKTLTDEEIGPVVKIVNQILEQVKDRSEAPQFMVDEAKKSLDEQMKRIENAELTAKNIDEAISNLETKLDATTQQNQESAEKFEVTIRMLDSILDENMSIKREFAAIQKRIDQERKGNSLLIVVSLILILVVFHGFLKSEN